MQTSGWTLDLTPPRRAATLAGRVITTVAVAFMVFDGVLHLTHPAAVTDAFARLGWPSGLSTMLGALELACTALYVTPPVAAFGALLLTGYLGGAVATHVRVRSSGFETAFPVIVGALVWTGLVLRDPRVRALLRRTGR